MGEKMPENSFKVENATDLLLVLLYSPGRSGAIGESIEGVTRLQKLMFLLEQDSGPGRLVQDAQSYGFMPYRMGPFSTRLREDVEELKSAGILKVERLEFLIRDDGDPAEQEGSILDRPSPSRKPVESYRLSLTDPVGMQIGEGLWRGLSSEEQQEMSEFKRFFSSLTLRQLLIFTYERFPAYTSESEIKEQLGLL